MTKALIFGTFDKLHKGHIYFIRKASEIVNDADENTDKSTSKKSELYVVVARDKNVSKLKNKEPRDNELARMMNVYMLGLAKKVVLGDDEDFFKVIDEIKPNIICLGYDQDEQGLSDYIKKKKLKIEIKRIDAFEPETYKSSKL